MAWKASWAHRTGENEKIMIKKSRSKRRVPVISPGAPGNPVALVKMRNGVSYLLYMYTLGAGIKSIIIVCLLNIMAWKVSWAHRTGENEKKKKDNDKIKSRSKRRAPVERQYLIQ